MHLNATVAPSDDGWLHRAVDVHGEVHIIEELQVFEKAQPVLALLISSALVRARSSFANTDQQSCGCRIDHCLSVQRSVYVSSSSGLVQLPMAACRRYTSCYDCVFARDPFCGWDGKVCVEVASRAHR